MGHMAGLGTVFCSRFISCSVSELVIEFIEALDEAIHVSKSPRSQLLWNGQIMCSNTYMLYNSYICYLYCIHTYGLYIHRRSIYIYVIYVIYTSIHLYIYTYVHIYMYTYIHIYIYIYVLYIYIYTHPYINFVMSISILVFPH